MKRSLLYLVAAIVLASGMVAPVSAQTGPPTLTITPSSGPVGTVITANISNCFPNTVASDGLSRLDFAFDGETPANTVGFIAEADGTTSVDIEVLSKADPSDPGNTSKTEGPASVSVSQCGNEGGGEAAFTVTTDTTGGTTTGGTTTGGTTTGGTTTGGTTTGGGTTGGGTTGGGTTGGGTTGGGTADRLPQAQPATPQKAQPTFTG